MKGVNKKNEDFDKYKRKGAYHWDKVTGPLRRRHIPRTIRYAVPYKILVNKYGKKLNQLRGLDIGCGEGAFMKYILSKNGNIDGLDNNNTAIDLGHSLLEQYNGKFHLYNSPCENVPVADSTYDYVVALEVIEHLKDVNSFCREVKRILKNTGLLIVTTPFYKGGPYGDKYHVKEFTPIELKIPNKLIWFIWFSLQMHRNHGFRREVGNPEDVSRDGWTNLLATARANK